MSGIGGWSDLLAVVKAVNHDEYGHLDAGKVAWGYISAYDIKTGMVKVFLPLLPGQQHRTERSGRIVTPWVLLGSPYVGDGYGLEVYPETGTPCALTLVENHTGAGVVASMQHTKTVPVNSNVGDLQPGDFRIVDKSGNYFWFQQDGTVTVEQVKGGNLTMKPDWDVELQGKSRQRWFCERQYQHRQHPGGGGGFEVDPHPSTSCAVRNAGHGRCSGRSRGHSE